MKALLAMAIGLAAPETTTSPEAAVSLAAQDLRSLPEGVRPYIRYLSLYNIPSLQIAKYKQVLDFHVNSLSRSPVLEPTVLVGRDLLRLNYRDYKWNPAIWERLLKEDPYFHLEVKLEKDATFSIAWPGGKTKNGTFYKQGFFQVEKKAGSKIFQHAPWLPTKDISYLREETYSEVPILRADFFLHQTAIQDDRVAGYYDFLQLGNKEKDFQELIGADTKISEKLGKEIAAILIRSGVTLQNRAIYRYSSHNGGYWATVDFKKSKKKSNVIRFLDKDLEPPKGDASEQYGFLANGLFAFWLQNGQGLRQDKAPNDIAGEGKTPHNDKQVHIGMSCIRCHIEGIRPIDDDARKIYTSDVRLLITDYDKLLRFRQLYFSDLNDYIKRDQTDYSKALLTISKMKPGEMAVAYAKVWDNYQEEDLLPKDIAREIGVSEKFLVDSLRNYEKINKSIDPGLAPIIKAKPVALRREYIEESFGLIKTILKGYIPKE